MLVAFVSSLRQREQRAYESTVGSRVSTIMFIFVSAEFVLRNILLCRIFYSWRETGVLGIIRRL